MQRQPEEAGVAILTSDKIDFKPNTVTRNKESHYIMTKGSIHQKDIILVNIHALDIKASNYLK